MRKYTKAIVGALVSFAAVFAILHNINLSEVVHATAGTNKPLILVGVIAVGIGYGIRSFRWWRMLRVRSNSISLGTTARILMASFAANNVLPLRAGDALRGFGFRAALQAPSAFVIATIVLERLLDLLTLLLLGLCFIRIGGLSTLPAEMVRLIQALSLAAMAVLVAILIFARQIRWYSLWVLNRTMRNSERSSKIQHAISNLFGLFESIRPLEAIHLVLLSVAAWSFEAVLYVCVAKAVHLDVSFAWPCMALLAANLSAIIPSSPGYVGTFHASILATLLLAGVERNSATAYAVIVHGVLWVVVTLAGGISYFLLRGESAQPARDSTGEIL